jgi:RNA polymerase sigma factor (sigma-70 family)
MDKPDGKYSVFSATINPKIVSNRIMTDDQAFVSRVRSGDEQAFRLLIKQHERLVAHMVGRLVKRHEDREELCQDVFLKIFEKLPEFNFQSRLSTWIATIAYRHAINHLRKQKMTYTEWPEDAAWTEQFIEKEDPETIFSESDMNRWVLKLIDQLPPQYRTVLTLYHLDGMNYAEIGIVTEMPEGTVKNYLFRARQLLKEKVKKNLGE